MNCLLCKEPILPFDDARDFADGSKVHAECGLRNVLGGIEHLTAPAGHPTGSCYDGSTLSYRESARQAMVWFKEHGEEVRA